MDMPVTDDPTLLLAIKALREEFADAQSLGLHGSIQVVVRMQDGHPVAVASDRHRGWACGIPKRIPAGQKLRQS